MRLRASLPQVVAVLAGSAAGIGVFTFGYAKGASYLVDDPEACANCHVMQEHLDDWSHSSHHAVATCNDCHTPAGLVPKYATKAINGFWHSFAFTTGRFPPHIRIGPRNRAITEGACRKCHAEVVAAIDPHPAGSGPDATACIRCHANVAHLP